MNKLMQNIVEQSKKVEAIKSDIEILGSAMLRSSGIIWESLWDKKWELTKSLPKEREKLMKLYLQLDASKNNRQNRRQELLSSMQSKERVIPA